CQRRVCCSVTRFLDRLLLSPAADVRDPAPENQKDHETENHSEARCAESPVPARIRIEAVVDESLLETLTLREVAADERSQHCADVDTHVKDREAAVATRIVFAVETADHRADVWFQKTSADRDEHHAEIERRH